MVYLKSVENVITLGILIGLSSQDLEEDEDLS